MSSLKNHGNTEASSLSVIPSRPRDARPCRAIYAERFAFISHRFALISPHARVGWGLARLVEMTNHAVTPSPSVLLTFLRYENTNELPQTVGLLQPETPVPPAANDGVSRGL